MSAPIRTNSTVQLACATVVLCFTISAVVILAIAVPDGGNAGSLTALLLANLATALPLLLNLGKTANIERVVEHQANGGGDAKIKAAVHAVLDERDPGVPGAHRAE